MLNVRKEKKEKKKKWFSCRLPTGNLALYDRGGKREKLTTYNTYTKLVYGAPNVRSTRLTERKQNQTEFFRFKVIPPTRVSDS